MSMFTRRLSSHLVQPRSSPGRTASASARDGLWTGGAGGAGGAGGLCFKLLRHCNYYITCRYGSISRDTSGCYRGHYCSLAGPSSNASTSYLSSIVPTTASILHQQQQSYTHNSKRFASFKTRSATLLHCSSASCLHRELATSTHASSLSSESKESSSRSTINSVYSSYVTILDNSKLHNPGVVGKNGDGSMHSNLLGKNNAMNVFINALVDRDRFKNDVDDDRRRRQEVDDKVRALFESIIIKKHPSSSPNAAANSNIISKGGGKKGNKQLQNSSSSTLNSNNSNSNNSSSSSSTPQHSEFDYRQGHLVRMFLEALSDQTMYSIIGDENLIYLVDSLTMLELKALASDLNISKVEDVIASHPSEYTKARKDAFSRVVCDRTTRIGEAIDTLSWNSLCQRYEPLLTVENACVDFIKYLSNLDTRPNHIRGEMILRLISQFVQAGKYRSAASFLKKIKTVGFIDSNDLDVFGNINSLQEIVTNITNGLYHQKHHRATKSPPDPNLTAAATATSTSSEHKHDWKHKRDLISDLAVVFEGNDCQGIAFRNLLCTSLFHSFFAIDNNNSSNISNSSIHYDERMQPEAIYLQLVDSLIDKKLIVGSDVLNIAARLKFRAESFDDALKYFDIMELEKAFWYYHNVYRVEKPEMYIKSLEKFFMQDSMSKPSTSTSTSSLSSNSGGSGGSNGSGSNGSVGGSNGGSVDASKSLSYLNAYRQAQREIFNDKDYCSTGPISFRGHVKEHSKEHSSNSAISSNLPHLGVSPLSYISAVDGIYEGFIIREGNRSQSGSNSRYNNSSSSSSDGLGENISNGASQNSGLGNKSLVSGLKRLLSHDTAISSIGHQGGMLDPLVVHRILWLFSQSKQPSLDYTAMQLFVKRVVTQARIAVPMIDDARLENFFMQGSRKKVFVGEIEDGKMTTTVVAGGGGAGGGGNVSSSNNNRINSIGDIESPDYVERLLERIASEDGSSDNNEIIDDKEAKVGSNGGGSRGGYGRGLFRYDLLPHSSLDLLPVNRQVDVIDLLNDNSNSKESLLQQHQQQQQLQQLIATLHSKPMMLKLPPSLLRTFYLSAIQTLQHSRTDAMLCLQLASLYLHLDIMITDEEISLIMSAFIRNNLFKDCVSLYKQLALWGRAQSELNAHYMLQAMIGLKSLGIAVKMLRLLSSSSVPVEGVILPQLLRSVLFQLTPTGRQFDYGETPISDKVEDIIPLFLELLPIAIKKTALHTLTNKRKSSSSGSRGSSGSGSSSSYNPNNSNFSSNNNRREWDREDLIEHIVTSIVVTSQYHEGPVTGELIPACLSSKDPVMQEIGRRSAQAIDGIIHYFDKSAAADDDDDDADAVDVSAADSKTKSEGSRNSSKSSSNSNSSRSGSRSANFKSRGYSNIVADGVEDLFPPR